MLARETMGEPRQDNSEELHEEGCRFDPKQYEMLLRCSTNKDMTEWNEWRKRNATKDICLDGADLHGSNLADAWLIGDTVVHTQEGKSINYSGEVYLRKANLQGVRAEHATFGGAHLEMTRWTGAKLRRCDFHSAYLNEAKFDGCRADRCVFTDAVLRDASFTSSSIRGAKFMHSDLRGCSARAAIADGDTMVWECRVSRGTDFTGVGLDSIRSDPPTKELMKYGIRRKNWERWYKGITLGNTFWFDEDPSKKRARQIGTALRVLLTSPVRAFWWVSDYGKGTWRILVTFSLLALGFAVVYWRCPSSVIVCGNVGDIRGFLHAFYFSVVTMTTLGFGDIAANPDSWQGQVFLMIQVILGYLLLGALVTRFSVLFVAGGPAARFAAAKSRSKAHRRRIVKRKLKRKGHRRE
jgi:uncharacterized protein YjbI with pentapeptide repeats